MQVMLKLIETRDIVYQYWTKFLECKPRLNWTKRTVNAIQHVLSARPLEEKEQQWCMNFTELMSKAEKEYWDKRLWRKTKEEIREEKFLAITNKRWKQN